MADPREDVTDNTSTRTQVQVRLPLNSSRITAGQLRRLSTVLGITSSGSINDLRLIIQDSISHLGHEPRNVQVVFDEYYSSAAFELWDESGKFLTVPPVDVEHSPAGDEQHEESGDERPAEETSELETLRQSVVDITRERDTLCDELETVRHELELEKARIKELWRMSCGQVAEHDTMIVSKDEEIARLKAQLVDQRHGRTPVSSDEDAPLSSEPLQPREVRRGRAPPIDTFTGEDPAIRLEDWLPGLERVARWNLWTPEEKVIQLAGHLRGRAEAEWNSLGVVDVRDFNAAVRGLKERLDPCSKVLAGQDFRRTVQGDCETVADYICRLERAFRVAFGCDGLCQETKEAMLYGQLQEGLRIGIIRSPNVSGV